MFYRQLITSCVRALLIMPQLALITQPENYEIMFRREKTKFLADLILLLFDHIITEFYDFTALGTDEMLMMLLSGIYSPNGTKCCLS